MRSSDLPVSAYLPLRYVLTDTVAVRTRRDPLQVETELTVSGRAQRGMLAAVLRRAGREEALHDWVARGHRVCFAAARPRLEPGAVEDGTPHPDPATARVACPVPANLYTPGKDGTTLVDVFGPTDPSVPYKAVPEPLTPDRVLRARVRTITERFLARPGRHTPGGPFHTTALDAGQVFEARWHLRAQHTRALQGLAHDILDTLDQAGGSLTLGSGGTRAHGGVRVGPADPDRPLSPDRVRLPWTERSVPPGGTLDLLLLAPALVVGAHGGASPRSLVAEVADLCERALPGAGIEVGTAHVESVLVGAYHRGYHGPMAQRWAAAPGAVVRLSTRAGLSTEQVRELESHQVGERTVEGYGQFALLPPPPEDPVPLPPTAEPVARTVPEPSGAHAGVSTVPPGPGHDGGGPASATRLTCADGHVPSPGRPGEGGTELPGAEQWDGPPGRLQDALLWDAARPVVRVHARARARACEHLLPPLTPGILDRLRATLTRPDRTPHDCLADLSRAVAGGDGVLSAKAVRALEHARPTGAEHPRPVTAREWLSLSGDPGAVADWWADHRPAPGTDPDYSAALAAVALDLADGRPPAPGALSPRTRDWEHRAAARLARTHLVAWMTEAARLLRARGGARP